MSTPQISTARQRQLIGALTQLVHDRARGEVEIDQDFERDRAAEIERYETDGKQRNEAYQQHTGSVNEQYTKALADARCVYESGCKQLDEEEKGYLKQSHREKKSAIKSAKRNWKDACHRAVQSFNMDVSEAKNELEEFQKNSENHQYELQLIHQHLHLILSRRRCRSVIDKRQDADSDADDEDAYETFVAAKQTAIDKLQELDNQSAARFFDGGWTFLYFLIGIVVSFCAVFLASWYWQLSQRQWIGGSVAVGLILGATITLAVYRVVQRQTRGVARQLAESLHRAQATLAVACQATQSAASERYTRLVERRDVELAEADGRREQVSDELESEYDERAQQATGLFQDRRQIVEQQWETAVRPHKDKYPPLLSQLKQDFENDTVRRSEEHERNLSNLRREQQQSWKRLIKSWNRGNSNFQSAIAEMNDRCQQHFPVWDSINWRRWQPPHVPVPLIRFGQYQFHLDKLEGGLPRDERMHVPQNDFVLPAVLSFPDEPSVLLECSDEGRIAAIHSLQNMMLRLLTSLPPGKVRFTIIDPTGLGQNFSAFMHLADFDPRLVSNRIWTESAHINQRLMDLTQHMEDVIQKYLRNQFESIQQYNEFAGEVAEPFQILVVANFPANFSEEAARRLVSIATSGARCGVHTLISCDTKMNLPRNFDLVDLRAHATTLHWRDGRFAWNDPQLAHLPLELDQPPADANFTEAVQTVGRYAKDSNRVEVPFEAVTAEPDQWWSCDSRGGIEVALGRAGATKLQYLQLGEGTSQHVLIAGKTGAGKSTLLHALITNTAIHYAPNEVHFYLVDFKKGVEFKPYATFALPHARVIAIESEREFGMSVLERLDEELHRRGDLFRSAGVQDVEGFRDANKGVVLPRLMLIIDEFQELFVKDDKIAQDASLLLDRLVRQGRAFGIHVLLGSQTLAGAYSLARSTVGQMAVRIALQCSQADAHLILSEDNTAARLLNRPGEAIYNNANGLFEGNNPFQVVWLPDAEREQYLKKIGDLSRQRSVSVEPTIVFEGNIPAESSDNRLLRATLQAAPAAQTNLAPQTWIGAAVAIKDPTSVAFRRQSGANLLVVGQQEEMAAGVFANGLIGLASQLRFAAGDTVSVGARFVVCNGVRPDSSEANLWHQFGQQLPLDLEIVSPRQADPIIGQIAELVDQRIEEGEESAAPLFLVVYNLARFRSLRKSEDEFSFSSMGQDEIPNAAAQLRNILLNGPPVGVHTLIWCDNYTNVSRWLDRQSMRDLKLRVLFQTSAGDSSNLMDSPVASQLGAYRAILYSEEDGRYEKFRPYGNPSTEWLNWVQQCLIAGHLAPDGAGL